MQLRSFLSLLLLALLMLVATLTLAEDGPSEDACQGSTEGIDHLIYDEDGELAYLATVVLQETKEWVKYPCTPESETINEILDENQALHPWYKGRELRSRECVYLHDHPFCGRVSVLQLSRAIKKHKYPILLAVRVREVVGAFRFSSEEKSLFPGFLISVDPIELIGEQDPPSVLFVPHRGMQNAGGVNFCNRKRRSWRVEDVPEEGDYYFVLTQTLDGESIPIINSPTFVLQDGQLKSPGPFLVMESGEKKAEPKVSTPNEVIELLKAYVETGE